MTRHRLVRAGAALLMALAVVGASAPAAMAATRVVPDARGDAPARFDIVRATYRNDDTRITGRARVANLRGGLARFEFTFSPFNSPDVAFEASTQRSASGAVTTRLVFIDDLARRHRKSCALVARWRPAADRVSLSVPRSCTLGISGALFMTEGLGPDRSRRTQDHVDGVRVRR